ncbi:hypothetical protein D3C84_806770 [compost metagenome]
MVSSTVPSIRARWKKPSYPAVHSGVCSGGISAWKRAARVWLLIMLPLAVPGCTLLPVMRTVALAALKFSYSSSPSSPPSTV